jgi:predicted naringenin-chalcone synthase
MSLSVVGIGTAVPEFEIDQADAAEQASELCYEDAEQRRRVKTLYRRTGVQKRRSVVLQSATNGRSAQQTFYASSSQLAQGPTTAERMLAYERHAGPLAIEAASRAIANATVSPFDISHVITVSCSGFSAPGLDIEIVGELGLSAGVARTHIGFMGCHGALNGLRVARAFAEADTDACVLLCAVELCTLHLQYGWLPDQIVANALFADGAAALVARRTTAADSGWQLVDQASAVIPGSRELMSWRVRDHGFQMTLSSELPGLIGHALEPWLAAWLGRHGLTIAQIASWAIHPGGPRILSSCSDSLGLAAGKLADSQAILAECGNMSSPTILFVLDRLRRREAPGPCVALAFGPGITIEAALFA